MTYGIINLKRLGTFQPPNVCRSCLSQLFFPAIAMDVTIGAKYDKSMDSLDQCRRSQLRSGSLMKSKKTGLYTCCMTCSSGVCDMNINIQICTLWYRAL